MGKQKTLVPWFQRGDIGGMTYSITNNIVNYLIVIATLSGVLEWPDKIVYGYVIPGMSIGLLCSEFTMLIWEEDYPKKKVVRMLRHFLPEFPHRQCL